MRANNNRYNKSKLYFINSFGVSSNFFESLYKPLFGLGPDGIPQFLCAIFK